MSCRIFLKSLFQSTQRIHVMLESANPYANSHSPHRLATPKLGYIPRQDNSRLTTHGSEKMSALIIGLKKINNRGFDHGESVMVGMNEYGHFVAL